MELEKGKEYIRPGEVPPSLAEKVLAFLNTAKTAEEIAEAVEFPKERDVGIKVAQNILVRRDELDGFKNLRQVYKVPQVGPERFTEIVRALGKMEDVVSHKLDSSMRRLLKMSEVEIRRQFKRDRSRLAKNKKEIDEIIRRLPPTATESDRNAIAKVSKILQSGLLPHRNLVAVIPDKLKPVRIRAIVRFTGNRADLEAMGIEVRSQAQDVFTIVGTQKQLQDLAGQPACRRLHTPRMLFPTVEHASGQGEVANVHDPRPLNPTGFRGNGILVGIIDSPLDVTHHGFRDPLGTHDSRVLYYWAQSTHIQGVDMWGNPTTVPQANPPGQTPQQFTNAAAPGTRPNFVGLNYGRLYTNNNINTALGQPNPYGTGNNQICCEPTETSEHGTHCAGIAAGSGHVTNWATNPTHVGAAPEADIVHVRLEMLQGELDTGGTFEDALLDGIDFCLRVAQFHNMPIAISVSQGSNFGPHNGSTDFDLARDNFLNSFDNRSILFAAGNDNDNNGYRRGSVPAGNNINSFTLTARRNLPMWLDVWYTGPELDYRISFGGNDSGWRTSGQDYTGIVSGQDIEAERDIESGGGLRGIRIYMEDASFGDVYTIELRNPHASQAANYHAWSGLQGWWADLSGPTNNEMTLSDTGCGKSIITVGACDKVRPPNPATGESVTLYSGAGPTVDGRIKPEIVAVGGTPDDPTTPGNEYDPIMSTASDQNNGYVGMIGTSMATPLVAGAVALLFEEYGSLGHNLNQDTMKALITQYANRLNLNLDPNQPGYVAEERNRYGYGRLRMIGPIDHILPPVDVDLWVRTADDDYGEEPYPGGCFCGAPDIRVFQAGTNNETTQINWGTTYDVRVTVRNLGDTDAVGANVRLKYTLPHAAPNDWFEAEDASNNKLTDTVTVPAMDDIEVLFNWRPEAAEIGAPAGQTHFCLLAEVDHTADPLIYPAPTLGGSAWSTNIKSTNNVALRNLHIQ
jgi:subtilisin family serine protease